MRRLFWLGLVAVSTLSAPLAQADSYTEAVAYFKAAGESADFFRSSYAYVIFPNIGEGGFVVGGQGGKGRVFHNGHVIGYSKMGGLSVGFQAGAKVFSEVVFFQDKRALDEFESGSFQFDAGTSATAITASVGASVGTNGAQANASGTAQNATNVGRYNNGMAVFTVAKGGLMYAATVGGQKFTFEPRAAH